MKYKKKDQELINNWLIGVGAPYLVDEEFYEYKDGQLLEIAKAKEDSLLTWDEWQHLQNMMGMEVPLKMAILFTGVLYENSIDLIELSTDNSKEIEAKWEDRCKKEEK